MEGNVKERERERKREKERENKSVWQILYLTSWCDLYTAHCYFITFYSYEKAWRQLCCCRFCLLRHWQHWKQHWCFSSRTQCSSSLVWAGCDLTCMCTPNISVQACKTCTHVCAYPHTWICNYYLMTDREKCPQYVYCMYTEAYLLWLRFKTKII